MEDHTKASTNSEDSDSLSPELPLERGRYAGFWRRVAASSLDGLLLFVVLIVVIGGAAFLILLPTKTAPENPSTVFFWQLVGSATIAWLYFATAHSSQRQATWGKRIVGIKVVDQRGERITFARASGRYLAYIITAIPTSGLSCLPIVFTAKRRALHDMVGGTLVVSSDATAQDVISGLAAPKISGRVVALAPLALVLPAASILGTPVLIRMQDDAVRSQVSSGLTLASFAKSAITRAYEEGAQLSEISSDSLGLPPAGLNGRYVSSIWIRSGVIEIQYGDKALPPLRGQVVLIVPFVTPGSRLVWVCGHRHPPEGAEPTLPDFESYTSVPTRYLPDECRP